MCPHFIFLILTLIIILIIHYFINNLFLIIFLKPSSISNPYFENYLFDQS